MAHTNSTLIIGSLLALGLAACDDSAGAPDAGDAELRGWGGGGGCNPWQTCGDDNDGKNKPEKKNTGARNMHLEATVRFPPLQPGADADTGRILFGLDETLTMEDTTGALFEGLSVAGNGPHEITSNGRTCFTCHRGQDENFGLPVPPLSDTIALTDTLFTGIDADAGGDPDAMFNLDQLGLVKYRVNRFDPRGDPDRPYRQVFGWRKSPKLLNAALQQGFLTDLRGRVMFETARGAVFSHTQNSDDRFDDLFPVENGNDMEAFIFSIFTDPQLEALRDDSDPAYDALVDDPFSTVPITTWAEKRGKKVFKRDCFACHNTPQVFSSLENVEPLGAGDRTPDFPSWAPSVGKAYNVGVSEANVHGLRFTKFVGPGDYEPIVLAMAAEDGEVVMHEVEFDIGLAMTTGRVDDIGRFKVPQLRDLANNAPYFHDNSAATIEEVVDYFCSDDYNDSHDGQHFQIDLTPQEKADLTAFLYAL